MSGNQTSIETRYYSASLAGDVSAFAQAVRAHWGIENKVHWVPDVAFREDDSRVRHGYAPENFAVLRPIALNLLRHETSAKCGVKAKRLKAGWDEDYLLQVLSSLDIIDAFVLAGNLVGLHFLAFAILMLKQAVHLITQSL